MGPYYFTALVHLLGPIASVVATGSRSRDTRQLVVGPNAGQEFPVEVPTHLSVLTSFEQGGNAQSLLSFDTRAVPPRRRLRGERHEGTIVLPDPKHLRRGAPDPHRTTAGCRCLVPVRAGVGDRPRRGAHRGPRPRRARHGAGDPWRRLAHRDGRGRVPRPRHDGRGGGVRRAPCVPSTSSRPSLRSRPCRRTSTPSLPRSTRWPPGSDDRGGPRRRFLHDAPAACRPCRLGEALLTSARADVSRASVRPGPGSGRAPGRNGPARAGRAPRADPESRLRGHFRGLGPRRCPPTRGTVQRLGGASPGDDAGVLEEAAPRAVVGQRGEADRGRRALCCGSGRPRSR